MKAESEFTAIQPVTQPRSQGLRGETGDEDPGKIRFIVSKFWEKNRMRSETQRSETQR